MPPDRAALGQQVNAQPQTSRAALDRSPSGLTHVLPVSARFPPQFAAAAIEAFPKPGEPVPTHGGATTIVEAITRGAARSDRSELSRRIRWCVQKRPLSLKVTALLSDPGEYRGTHLSYGLMPDDLAEFVCPHRTQN